LCGLFWWCTKAWVRRVQRMIKFCHVATRRICAVPPAVAAFSRQGAYRALREAQRKPHSGTPQSVALKDSFQNTAYLERDMPYFAFVSTNAVLVRKIDKP